jgi:hypothetical protein
MSKFIRTKEGIEELVYNSEFEYYVTMHTETIISEAHIGMYQAANTIEELCDEAVAVYPDGLHDNCSVMHIVDNNGFCEAVYGCLSVSVDDLKKDYERWEVYGAIWTDKGLIYVAKMNEKGELELI